MTLAKPSKKMTPRLAAVTILSQLLKQQGSLASLLPQYLSTFSAQEKSFAKELCYGCCRWYPLLDELLNQLLKQPLKKKDADIKAVLLLGVYQLQFMSTADHAAINESVNAAKFFNKLWAKKLINAVLRVFQRDQETLFSQAKKRQANAHPAWLEKTISSAWPEQAQAIFTANNQHPPFSLRVNQKQQTREQYLALLKQHHIEARPASYSESGIYLDQPLPVNQLPLFDQGAVSVQDEAAQLAAFLLELKPNIRVLDACCAPGGKTCHIAEMEPHLTQLTAIDSEEKRLQKVHENLQRLNIDARVLCGDGTQPKQWWDGQVFDRILLDAPCSATGIIRRQPDIKLLREPDHIETLADLQYQLLCALWPLLAEGGILLYATCSILPKENTQTIERFITTQKDVVHEPIDADWGIAQPYGRQLFPQEQGHDGFYYAKLRKS
jgi:16S rRNA (cytosine967-C5)-methyltransferase